MASLNETLRHQAHGADVFVASPSSENGHLIIPSILDLPDRLVLLEEPDRRLVQDLFEIKGSSPRQLVFPEQMRPWVMKIFGDDSRTPEETLALLENPRITRVQDKYLKDAASYNASRRKRPQPERRGESPFQRDINDPAKQEACKMCPAEHHTPYYAQLGRRSFGDVSIVANLTPFAEVHLLALGNHDPYATTKDQYTRQMHGILESAREFSTMDPNLKFLFLGLNNGYRAAGSQPHHHLHGLLEVGTMNFPHAEKLVRAAHDWRVQQEGQRSNFFTDYFRGHEVLGLGARMGKARVLSMLLPWKEHGVMVIDEDDGGPFHISEDFINALWEIQQFMVHKEGVREYNIDIFVVPNNPDSPEYWSEYRTVAVFTDRGDSSAQNSDIGFAELGDLIVVTYDPFDFGPKLNRHLLEQAAA